MQLPGAVKDVDEKKIVEQKVFNEVVAVEALFIRHGQVLDLEAGHPADHVRFLARALGHQHIFQGRLVKDLKIMAPHQLLAVQVRARERCGRRLVFIRIDKRRRQRLPVGHEGRVDVSVAPAGVETGLGSSATNAFQHPG